MSNVLYELREMLMHELKSTFDGSNALTAEKLEIYDKITHCLKSIDTICAMEEAKFNNQRSGNNSYGYNSYADGGYNNSYNNSYRMNRSYDSNSGTYYSMPDMRPSWSDGHSDMIRRLDEMLRTAKTDKEREAIRLCMDKLNA